MAEAETGTNQGIPGHSAPRGCPGRVLELRQPEGQEVPELSEQGGPGGIAETKMGCCRAGG